MLTGVIISPSAETAGQVQQGVESNSHVAIARAVDRYLSGDELKRFLQVTAPEIVFLSVADMAATLAAAAEIETHAPGTQIVAFGEQSHPQVLLELMRAGVREFLAVPLDTQALMAAIARVTEILEKRPRPSNQTDLVFSFLPAKPGVGTSTVALNITMALSRISEKSVLLADFDLNQGMIAFMLKMETRNSIIEAAERILGMDENLWAQLVLKRDKLDVLGAGHLRPGLRIESAQVRRLLDFTRRCYGAVGADLSGNMEKYSIDIMQESKLIFLVTTPEIPSLHLARGKMRFLESQGLGDRVRVLLNRTGKKDTIALPDVEKLLGVPVHAAFPNDYVRVHRALTEGKHVEVTCELGKRFEELARMMLDRKAYVKAPRRFVEYFSLVPARFN
ncbi:MAG TPA: hypothetical protein VKV15_12490 [Bryobacteraceae bacterium]|nr:hypothetical protein [Bryobacteraceae bacterium]